MASLSTRSTSTQFHSIRNVVVVGEAGVGKSSLINLVTGVESAITGNDVRGITIKAEYHDWVINTQIFRLWDTPGLNEGSLGSVPQKEALDKLRLLFRNLKKEGGVHLVVHCMRGLPGITKGMKKIYKAIARVREKAAPDVPLVAVITELEKISGKPDIIASMEQWWKKNNVELSSSKMLFSGHACITTLSDDCNPELPARRGLCQELVRRLIFQGALPKLVRNVVIAGEIGSGKSSLVNLVLGSEQAVAAHDLSHVSGTTKHYDFETDNQIIHLWDTPGLWEGLQGVQPQRRAQEALRSLFADLDKRGGIHLLIICIPGILNKTRKVYDFIMQMHTRFCPTTPVYAVITGLEDLSAEPDPIASMERWWEDNLAKLTELKMFFSGHACITTSADVSNTKLFARHDLCQGLVRRLIIQGVSLRNVVVSGEIGAGKSSLINLVLGSEQAITANGLAASTMATSHYDMPIDNQLIRLWDTPGLWDGLRGNGPPKRAQDTLRSLFTDLGKKGGVHLLVVCIPGTSDAMASTKKVYDEIMRTRIRFCPETPVVLVITGLEGLSAEPNIIGSMEELWQSKTTILSGLSSARACITTLPDSYPPQIPGRREACQKLVRNLITEHCLAVAI